MFEWGQATEDGDGVWDVVSGELEKLAQAHGQAVGGEVKAGKDIRTAGALIAAGIVAAVVVAKLIR